MPMEYPVPDPLDVEQLLSKKRPWADVQAYGAKGNGSHDDTSAIQEALNSSNFVFLPPLDNPSNPGEGGNFYRVTDDLTIPDHTTVMGSYYASIIGGTESTISNIINLGRWNSLLNLWIATDPSLASQDITSGIRGDGTGDNKIMNCKVRGMGGVISNGLYITGDSWGHTVTNFDVDSAYNGIYLTDTSNKTEISNTLVYESANFGVFTTSNTWEHKLYSIRIEGSDFDGLNIGGNRHSIGTVSLERGGNNRAIISAPNTTVETLNIYDIASSAGGAGVVFSGDNISVENALVADPNANLDVGVNFYSGTSDNSVNNFRDIHGRGIGWSGARNVVNKKSPNSGDPSSGGDWNGYASRASKENIVVEDTSVSPHDLYKAMQDGNWVLIGG